MTTKGLNQPDVSPCTLSNLIPRHSVRMGTATYWVRTPRMPRKARNLPKREASHWNCLRMKRYMLKVNNFKQNGQSIKVTKFWPDLGPRPSIRNISNMKSTASRRTYLRSPNRRRLNVILSARLTFAKSNTEQQPDVLVELNKARKGQLD